MRREGAEERVLEAKGRLDAVAEAVDRRMKLLSSYGRRPAVGAKK